MKRIPKRIPKKSPVASSTASISISILVFLGLIFSMTTISWSEMAVNDYLHFKRISQQFGMPSAPVHCIIQDSKGFMWFGTYDGLARYDGYDSKTYKPAPNDPSSLSHNVVIDIKEDKNSNLWISTAGGGLNLWHRETETFTCFKFDINNPDSLSNDSVRQVLLNDDGTVWVATQGGGLNLLNPQTGKFKHFLHNDADINSLTNNSIRCLFRDHQGKLWIGTEYGGLNQYDPETGQFTYYQNDPANPRSLSDRSVNAIAEDREGYLWLGTTKGVCRLHPERNNFDRFVSDPLNPNALHSNIIETIMMDRDGVVWIGTDGGGLSRFDSAKQSFITYHFEKSDNSTLISDVIRFICQDRDGDLWLGHWPSGVSYSNRLNAPFKTYRNNPIKTNTISDDIVHAFVEDASGGLWIGTDRGGLNYFNQNTGQWNSYQHNPADPKSLSAKAVLSLLLDHNNQLWVGTWNGGLNRFEPNTGTFRRYLPDPNKKNALTNPHVWDIAEDHQGRIWIATGGGGINRYIPEEDAFTSYHYDPNNVHSINHEFVLKILVTRDGVVWAGTQGGLMQWNPSSDNWNRFTIHSNEPGELSNNAIMDLMEGKNGLIWICTEGGGLKVLNRTTGIFTQYQMKDGLLSNVIHGIEEDQDGILWISTNKGISRFDPRTRQFRTYDEENGLQGSLFNNAAHYQSKTGELYFGGINGFTVFNPRDIKPNTVAPPVVITNFEILNQPINPGKKESPLQKSITDSRQLAISAKYFMISFQFAALNYRSPAKNQFEYKLEGFNADWQKAGPERRATYTNLNPGKYKLHIKASNDEGVWNEKGTTLDLIILPLWWQTWWFRCIVLLLIAGSLLIIGWTISDIRSNAKLREAEREQQLAQERQNAEMVLRQSEERYHHILDNIPVGIYRNTAGKDGRFLLANPAIVSMFGYESQEEFLQTPVSHFYRNYEERQAFSDKLIALGRIVGEEIEFKKHDGTIIYTSISARVVKNDAGGIEYFDGIIEDITKRKQLETALEKRIIALTRPLEDVGEIAFDELFDLEIIQKLQDLFAKATNVGSIITHPNGIPITKPSNFCRLCQNLIRQTPIGLKNCYISDSFIGRNNPEGPIIHPCLSSGLWDAGASITVGGKHIATWMIGQVRNADQDDQKMREYAREIGIDEEEFMIALQEVPFMTKEDFEEVTEALFTLANQLSTLAYQNIQQARFITERKQAEEENSKLQEQLRQSQKMEAIGRLAGGIAHDFNNILTAILGYSRLALRKIQLTDPLYRDIELINKAGERAASLTNQLLAFSRKQMIQPRIINLNKLILDFDKMLRPILGEDIELRIITETNLNSINADPGQIDQILMNLSVNARDAMPEGGHFTIETKNVILDKAFCQKNIDTVPGNYVLMSASDSGCGMTKEILDNIFEPFFTTKGQAKGTGLGLATVYGIVNQNKGTIIVQSEPGKGTTFQIYFPAAGIPDYHPVENKPAKENLRGIESILIVEDEEMVCQFVAKTLYENGYSILTAGHFNEAKKIMNECGKPLDLLITDVVLPQFSGKEVAETLLQMQPSLKVIFMSGYTDDTILRHSIIDEKVNFLQKPFTNDTLLIKVRELLDAK